MSIIKIQTTDGVIIETNAETIQCSETIKFAIEIEKNINEVVPLPTVTSKMLRKVLEWCEYHKNDDPGSYSVLTDDICDWDNEYLNVEQGTLFELAHTAQYLKIEGLYNLCAETIHYLLKDKIRKDEGESI